MSDAPNAEMKRFWNEVNGPRWVKLQHDVDTVLEPFGQLVLERAQVGSGQRVLEIGCGTGKLALDAAARVGSSGRVTGVDISEPMLALARERAERAGVTNVELVLADAQCHAFTPASFDRAISRFGVMFFEDPVAAFENIRGALVPGGRLAFVCFQAMDRNPWAMVPLGVVLRHVKDLPKPPPGAPGPFAFADRDRLQGLLERAGFGEVAIDPVEREVPMGATSDVAGAADFLSQLGPAAAVMRERPELADSLRSELERELAKHEKPNQGVRLAYAVWLVTARA